MDLLYVNDHRHPSPREEARASGLAAFHPERELPEDFRERFALDHEHPVHLEDQGSSPFAAAVPVDADEHGGADSHEHPPWTATSRGVEMSLRRLAMLEPVYRLAPDLLQSGRVNWPVDADAAASREVRMTDFRLLRRGGFYQAVARYGEQVWTPFTYAGLHATERVIRRKEQHRFWGVDCYSSEEDRYLRIGNRTFYEDPDQEVEPSAQVVVAVDAWARELAQSTLIGSTPTLFCTPDGNCTPAVELRPSRDLVSDPSGHPVAGRPEMADIWLRQNPDVAAIDGRLAHRLFLTICQFPAMRASWLAEVAGGSPREVSRHLGRFVDTGLVAVFDGRHYLSELGMKRAANMSRVLPSVIRSRHGAYLDRWYREHEQFHNDGVNRLVVRFAREGVEAVAGWRGEVNVPGLTQVRPDLLVQVSQGALGAGVHCIEFERSAVSRYDVNHKLDPYRRHPAHADRHPGAGADRTADRAGDGVEQERPSSGAPLPVGDRRRGFRAFAPGKAARSQGPRNAVTGTFIAGTPVPYQHTSAYRSGCSLPTGSSGRRRFRIPPLTPGHPVADAGLGEDAGGVAGVVAQLAANGLHSGVRRSSSRPFRTAQTTISCFVPTPSLTWIW